MELWNNPSCSKCAAARETLAGLHVGPVQLRPYLEEPPTAAELASVLERLGAQPWDICRLGEPVAAELGLTSWNRDATTRQDWIEVMAANPVLIQRPILLFDDGTAMIARDAEVLAKTLSALSFRFATEADIPVIVELVESAYRGDASRVGWTHEADLLDGQRTDPLSVAATLSKPDSVVLLASQNGTLAACCHLERHHDFAYFGMFAVRPVLQTGGIGRQMLAEAERIIGTEWGLPEVHMTVVSRRQELISWYQRRGYQRTGKMSPFPYGDERFGIPKFDDLAFELLIKQLS